MATKKTVVHDGVKYWELTLEPILKNGIETGHFKEISRKQVIANGIFDDEVVFDEIINFINELHEKCQSDYYMLEGETHYEDFERDRVYLFSSFGLDPDYNSLGEAIVMFMLDQGWIVNEYHLQTFTYEGQELETIFFKYDVPIKDKYNRDNVCLFPVNATIFKF